MGRDVPAKHRDLFTAGRIFVEQLPHEGHPGVDLAAAELNLRRGHQQLGIAGGGLHGQVLAGRLEVAPGEERLREPRAHLFVFGIDLRGAPQHLDRFVVPLAQLERVGNRRELRDRRRALAGAREIFGGGVDVEELRADALVLGIDARGQSQRFDRFVVAGLLGQLAGNRRQLVDGAACVVHVEPRAGALDTGRVVGRIEPADSHAGHGGAARVARGFSLFENDVQVRARIRVQPLTRDELGGLQQRAFVVGLELEELLVDRRRLDVLPFLAKGIGDFQELFDRAFDLARAGVQIAERVRGIPVARLIFDDAQVFSGCGFELALTQQLFGVSQCAVAIERCH
jgi:hypothetical protein